MEQVLQDEFRADFIKDLHREAWRNYAKCAYDETKIGPIEEVKKEREAELETRSAALKEAKESPDAKTKAGRKKIEEAQGLVNESKAGIKGCDELLQRIQTSLQDKRVIARTALERAKHAESFVYQPEETPAV